jgi:hypothetical protein
VARRHEIPTHLNVEDRAFFGLSVRQVTHLMVGASTAYAVWNQWLWAPPGPRLFLAVLCFLTAAALALVARGALGSRATRNAAPAAEPATAEAPAPAKTSAGPAAATVVVPNLRPVQRLNPFAGWATGDAAVLGQLVLVGCLDLDFEVALLRVVALGALELTTELETLDRGQLVRATDRLARLRQERRSLRGILGSGGQRAAKQGSHGQCRNSSAESHEGHYSCLRSRGWLRGRKEFVKNVKASISAGYSIFPHAIVRPCR